MTHEETPALGQIALNLSILMLLERLLWAAISELGLQSSGDVTSMASLWGRNRF